MIGTRSGWRVTAAVGFAGAAMVLFVLAVLGMGAASARAARAHVFTGSFGSPSSGPGQLGEPAGIAVNEATGDVYVVDKANNRVEIFNKDGSKFEGEFNGSGLGLGNMGSGTLLNEGKAAGSGGLPEEVPSGRFDEPEWIAVDNDPSSPSFGDVYVADARGHKEGGTLEEDREVVDKFSATGEYIGQITRNPNGEEFSEDGFREIYGVAVDSQGEVWLAEHNYGPSPSGVANYTNDAGNTWVRFRAIVSYNLAQGLAVDSQDNIYVHTVFSLIGGPINAITEFSSGGELIKREVDEEAPTAVAAELSSNDLYISHLTNIHYLSADGQSFEYLTIPGGRWVGVAVNAATFTVYATDSAGDVVDMFGPEPPGAPTVPSGSESVKDVTATSASFSAEVNPRSEPNEEATSYSFEYGPCDTPTTCSSSPYVDSIPMPAGVLAPNYEQDAVSAHPQDLSAHTTYHMRLVAHNSHPGVAEGEEVIFTTQASGIFTLADGRVWEMVSPPNKYGAWIQASLNLSQAAAAGDAITYYANAPIEAQPPGNTDSDVQALAVRDADSWRSVNISAPHETAPGGPLEPEYHFFSTDLSVGLLQPVGAFVSSLSPEATEQTPFLRTNFPVGNVSNLCTSSCYTPLVTSAPGFENVPPGTVFGNPIGGTGECLAGECGPQIVGASPDASHVILSYTWASLVEGFTGKLYEWSDGRLIGVPGGELGGGRHGLVRNAVSSDGSRVVLSGGDHLYSRDIAAGETVQLDEVQDGSGAGALSPPAFQTASSDGSRVFFIDSQRLTKDANGPSNLYECEIVGEVGKQKCKLTDLTAGSNESTGPLGYVPGASEDGTYVYFVASAVLTGVQTNERSETAIAGQPNLYVHHDGVTKLIAVLSEEDSTDWTSQLQKLTGRVSPNGAWFSFMSDRPLTGFDNRDAISGKRNEEVFLYHDSENGEGKLLCASCNPTGGRPRGVAYDRIALGELGPGSGDQFGKGSALAAVLPGWTSQFYQSRYLSNSGRVFFDSFDALVPQDTNGVEDAYEFEPAGVGDCTEIRTSFVVDSSGCVSLISSGTSSEGSAFLDASESGGDVFFLTPAQLSPLDTDSTLDIYDAHECSHGEDCSIPVSAPVPACEGDACQSPGVPPEDPTPGSLTYQGPGNPTVVSTVGKPKSGSRAAGCRRGFVKRRGSCMKKKSKRRTKAKRSKRGAR
jgi:hypothetical protein